VATNLQQPPLHVVSASLIFASRPEPAARGWEDAGEANVVIGDAARDRRKALAKTWHPDTRPLFGSVVPSSSFGKQICD
jgi:hypothetical protein